MRRGSSVSEAPWQPPACLLVLNLIWLAGVGQEALHQVTHLLDALGLLTDQRRRDRDRTYDISAGEGLTLVYCLLSKL